MSRYLVGKLAFAIFILVAFSPAQAKQYQSHDPKRVVTVSETPAGKKYGIDTRYLDQMLNDLSVHAKNYPPQFDSPQDQQRAVQDAKLFSGVLDILVNGPNPHPELLLRAGTLHSLAYNLNIPGSAEKTSAIFQKILATAPGNPRGNYQYGLFLAGAAKPEEAIPYLEKALAAGIGDAAYALGMTHLSLGNKQKALANLESYQQRNPKDKNIAMIIEAIRSGNVEFKREK